MFTSTTTKAYNLHRIATHHPGEKICVVSKCPPELEASLKGFVEGGGESHLVPSGRFDLEAYQITNAEEIRRNDLRYEGRVMVFEEPLQDCFLYYRLLNACVKYSKDKRDAFLYFAADQDPATELKVQKIGLFTMTCEIRKPTFEVRNIFQTKPNNE